MKRPLKYRLAWWGWMVKEITPTHRRTCGIGGMFKTYGALQAAAQKTFGWQSGAFTKIEAFRKRVTLQEWEQAR